jgi:hypothetical protein
MVVGTEQVDRFGGDRFEMLILDSLRGSLSTGGIDVGTEHS